MKSEFYNNIIAHTLKHEKAAQSTDSLQNARAVFNNMGVALPGGDMGEVYETLKTNDYMGWRACSAQQAQAAADKGVAAIAISEDEIIILAANDADEPVEATASVMTLSETVTVSPASEIAYFCYNYGNTCGTSSTTVPKEYCGGSNYRDVTKHSMVLQSDGYYVCSKCGYSVKSPELEDGEILSTDDYLKVVAAMHYYTQCGLLSERELSISEYYKMQTDFAKKFIDSIRAQEKYTSKYSYSNSSGVCHGGEVNSSIVSLMNIIDINWLNIGAYNGLYASICTEVIGYYCPAVAAYLDIMSMITDQMNALDFGAFIAGMFEDFSEDMARYAKGLSIASTILGVITSGISLDDRVVDVHLDPRIEGYYIFDKNNKIKEVRLFLL